MLAANLAALSCPPTSLPGSWTLCCASLSLARLAYSSVCRSYGRRVSCPPGLAALTQPTRWISVLAPAQARCLGSLGLAGATSVPSFSRPMIFLYMYLLSLWLAEACSASCPFPSARFPVVRDPICRQRASYLVSTPPITPLPPPPAIPRPVPFRLPPNYYYDYDHYHLRFLFSFYPLDDTSSTQYPCFPSVVPA